MQSPARRIIGVEFGPCALSHLKHTLLYFDQLAVLDLENLKHVLRRHSGSDTDLANEYEFLQEQSLIFDPGFPRLQESQIHQHHLGLAEIAFASYEVHRDLLAQLFGVKRAGDQNIAALGDGLHNATRFDVEKRSDFPDGRAAMEAVLLLQKFEYVRQECVARLMAVQLSADQTTEAVPTMPHDLNEAIDATLAAITGAKQSVESRTATIEVVLAGLPVPDNETSWQEILEFRSDPDSRHKFLALREWLRDASRAKLSPLELEEKLEYLLFEYQAHMNLHRMKVHSGVLQTIVVATSEIIEDFVKLKFGNLAKKVFELRDRRIALLEAERSPSAPGRQVSYILKAQERFGDKQ